MSKGSEGLEWRVIFPDTMSDMQEGRVWCGFVFSRSIEKAWRTGTSDLNQLIHCFKVGVALCLVSLFYYMRPLYDGVGGNAMWAILTVVVAFEYTVGSTICKSVNRAAATLLAAVLGIGVHRIADQFGEKFEPLILQASVFMLAAGATYSRFMPSVKAQFDHGALIFIITFILVCVSGYRVGELFEMAHQRLTTIGIGTSICVLISMFFCPVWAGNELHNLVRNNMENIADSLDGCVAEYFSSDTDGKDTKNAASKDIMLGYTCVLDSRATEETLVNFAKWEPAHRGFNFGHPWKEYLQVGDLLRSCAYSIDALHGVIISDTKAPDFLKKHFSKFCIKLSSNSSAVLKELVIVMNTMTKSPKIDFKVEEMCNAVEEVQIALKALSNQPIETKSGEGKEESNASSVIIPFVDIVALVTLSALLIEIAVRTEKIVKAVNRLAQKATLSELQV